MTQVKPFIIANAGTKILVRQIEETDRYLVDKTGNVYSNHPNRCIRRLNITVDKYGYGVVSIHLGNGKRVQRLVHRLVAKAWITNTHNKPTVNHINENKLDNRIENLEWATVRENNLHSKSDFYKSQRGENHHASHLTEEDVLDIRMFCESGIDTRKIAEVYRISRKNVYTIFNKETWAWL